MKSKTLTILILMILLTTMIFAVSTKALIVVDYVVQTNIQSGVSGSINTAQNQIQLWWSGTYVTLKGPCVIHNQLVDTTNGKWQIVEDSYTTLQTSTNTQSFNVTETFNSNWQPIVDYTRILTISSYTAPIPTATPTASPTPSPSPTPKATPTSSPTPSPTPSPTSPPTPSPTPTPKPSQTPTITPTSTPIPTVVPTPTPSPTINNYVVQTNIQSGVSGSINTAQNQIQLWWSGTYVVLKGPIQIHNQLVDTTNGKWQIVQDYYTTLQSSTNTQSFNVTESFNSNWQAIVDYTRILTISSYPPPTSTTTPTPTATPSPTATPIPTSTPTPVQTKPMLAALLGSSDLTITQVQTTINSWTTQTGKGLGYYATVGSFGYPTSPDPMTQLDTYKPLVQQGLIQGVIFSWNPAYNNDQITGQQCITDINEGKYDTYLHQEAQRVRNDGYPIIIRFGPEFNGYWAGWGNNPAAFVTAWQRIVNIFRQENAANVRWFWCANYNSNPTIRVFTSYYPGDNYVDYVGVDMYANTQYSTWGTAEHQFTDPSGDVYDTYTNKPFIIGEFGLTNALTDTQNAQWLTGFFNSIDYRSRVVAITHYHETWNGAAVDLYPQAFSVYKTRIANYLPM